MRKWLKKSDKKSFFFILFSFLAWRIWLQVFFFLGQIFLPLKVNFLGDVRSYLEKPEPWAWANFDGQHYLLIIRFGYGSMQQAFFPVFPWLIKHLSFSTKTDSLTFLLSGLRLSHLAIFLALYLLYRLIRLDFDKSIARWTILFLLAFPASFFFASLYTESIFFVLAIGSFLAARKGRWWLAGVLGAIASGTRVLGVLLFPALLWEWFEQKKEVQAKLKPFDFLNLFFIFLIPTGLFFYMRYLNINYHDPFLFIHTQPSFGAQRSADKIILLYQVFWRYLRMIATTKLDPLYFAIWLEFLVSTSFLFLLSLAYFFKIRFSYLIFAAFAYLMPTLTGTFSSMPRYSLVLFPCFIVLGMIKNKFLRIGILLFFIFLLAISTMFFTRGWWVS